MIEKKFRVKRRKTNNTSQEPNRVLFDLYQKSIKEFSVNHDSESTQIPQLDSAGFNHNAKVYSNVLKE